MTASAKSYVNLQTPEDSRTDISSTDVTNSMCKHQSYTKVIYLVGEPPLVGTLLLG